MIKATATEFLSRVSDTVYSEITIEADLTGIHKLSNFLRQQDVSQAGFFDVGLTSDGEAVALTSVRVIKTGKKLACKKRGHCLEISGDADSLNWFAEYVADLAADQGFDHVHIEHYEGHPHLDVSHTSLVLSEI